MAEVPKNDLNIRPATGEAIQDALSPSSSTQRQGRVANNTAHKFLDGIIDGTIKDSAKTVERTILRPKFQQTLFEAGRTLLAGLVFGSGKKAEQASSGNEYDKMYDKNGNTSSAPRAKKQNAQGGYQDIEFDTYKDAENALNELKQEAMRYNGVATMASYYEHNGIPTQVQFNHFGWYMQDLAGAQIITTHTGFTLSLPSPRYLT